MNRAVAADALDRRLAKPVSFARLGDFGLALVWTFLTITSISNTMRDASDVSWLTTAHHAASCMVLVVSTILFVIRRPAKTRIGSWSSRIIAIVGSWLMPALIILPLTWTPDWLLTVTTAGLVAAHGLLFWALITLRRSFSIFPEARALIRSGPYGLVRHPLYATYLFIYPMFLLPRISLLAVVITALGIACELKRARDEEKVLGAAFPDYGEYAAATPRFIPRLSRQTP
jgi:protein-S-isoprenylcysteine O-methyltransferase Ste14